MSARSDGREVEHDHGREVETASGKRGWFRAAQLRLASAEEATRIAELAEEHKAHAASLTVGASVTWTVDSELGEERAGTIVGIQDEYGFALVQGASGEMADFGFADLRLECEGRSGGGGRGAPQEGDQECKQQ